MRHRFPLLLIALLISLHARADGNPYSDTAAEAHSHGRDVADSATALAGATGTAYFGDRSRLANHAMHGKSMKTYGSDLRKRLDYLTAEQDYQDRLVVLQEGKSEEAIIAAMLKRGEKITSISVQTLKGDSKVINVQLQANSAAEAERQLNSIRARGFEINRVEVHTVRDWTTDDLARNGTEIHALRKKFDLEEDEVYRSRGVAKSWRGLATLSAIAAGVAVLDATTNVFDDEADATSCQPGSPRCPASTDRSDRRAQAVPRPANGVTVPTSAAGNANLY